MTRHYDIIIVGGGMIGLACALALAKTDLSIAVIEHETPTFRSIDDQYDMRVIAVNQSTINFLQQINVWHAIEQQRVSRFDQMSVWAENSELHFNADELQQPELGYIVENNVIRSCLWQQAEATKNITLLHPLQLQQVTITNKVLIKTDQTELGADLIIAADGANSWLRQHLNFSMTQSDYQHHALVATVATEQAHQNTAWQHFLPDGPLAFLPLADKRQCSIVWSSTPEHITQLKQLSANDFNQTLTHAFNNKLGSTKLLSSRISFPLQRQHMKDYVSDHIAFIGDAAHRVHPLAGQGANLGFADANCLANIIANALTTKKSFFSNKTLSRYQRQRKYYNGKMLLTLDFVKTIFSTQSSTISTLRNAAIEKIDQHQTLKQFFLQQAQ